MKRVAAFIVPGTHAPKANRPALGRAIEMSKLW
jgi:hypothetical protein